MDREAELERARELLRPIAAVVEADNRTGRPTLAGVRLHPTDAGLLLTTQDWPLRVRYCPELVIDARQPRGTISATRARTTVDSWKTGRG